MLYGICTSGGRFRPFSGAKRGQNLRGRKMTTHKFPIFQRDLWWARQGLNLRPHPCEGCALPLSYAPVRRGHALSKAAGQAGASAMAGLD